MLRSALAHYRSQQRLQAVAVAAARSAWPAPARLTPVLTVVMRRAAQDGAQAVDDMLAEQNIEAPADGVVSAAAFAASASDGRPLRSLLEQAQTVRALELMSVTQVTDAGRVAAGVGIAARVDVGWTRMVNPPCCPRCAVLAGKFFRWNQGFQRHPGCDCRHIPTREDTAGDVRTDPRALFTQGKVNGVTKAEQKAISEGADHSQVINARRALYMDPAGRRLTSESTTAHGRSPGVRLTPEQIYRESGDDRVEAVRLLKRFGYLL